MKRILQIFFPVPIRLEIFVPIPKILIRFLLIQLPYFHLLLRQLSLPFDLAPTSIGPAVTLFFPRHGWIIRFIRYLEKNCFISLIPSYPSIRSLSSYKSVCPVLIWMRNSKAQPPFVKTSLVWPSRRIESQSLLSPLHESLTARPSPILITLNSLTSHHTQGEQTFKAIYGLKQSPRAWSETEARVELLCSIMIWKRNPGKKRAFKGYIWKVLATKFKQDTSRVRHP